MVAQSDPFSALHEWLSGGDFFTKLRITSRSPTNRILTTVEETPANTTLVTVPTSHTITTTTALSNPIVSQILTSHPPPEPTTKESAALLLHLILSTETLEPWLCNLANIATATTAPSIDSLLGTPLHPLASALRTELDILYSTWYVPITTTFPTHFDTSQTTKSSFLRAHGIIESRAFAVDTASITPYLDFCNHSPSPNAHVITDARGTHLIASEDIPAGVEVCIAYGDLSNMQLLLHWGFALEDNMHDEVLVALEQPDDIAKALTLAACSETEFSLTRGDPLPHALVRAARILALEGTELQGAVKRDYSRAVGKDAEKRAVDVLKRIVQSLRCHDDDFENWTEFDKFCKVYRIGLHRILDLTIDAIQELENAILELGQNGHQSIAPKR